MVGPVPARRARALAASAMPGPVASPRAEKDRSTVRGSLGLAELSYEREPDSILAEARNLNGEERPPLGKSGGAVQLVDGVA